jgi:hypothetical protein
MTTTRFSILVLALVAAGLAPGCAHVYPPYQPMPGLLYTDMQGPGTVIEEELGEKSGVAIAESWLGWFTFGDASIKSAAEDGGIASLTHVDYRLFSVLGVYARLECYAYGD